MNFQVFDDVSIPMEYRYAIDKSANEYAVEWRGVHIDNACSLFGAQEVAREHMAKVASVEECEA